MWSLMLVQGQSMAPSCPDGARIVVSRWAYRWRRPSRGDLVVIRSPEVAARVEIKRIIGVPHDEVRWHQDRIEIGAPPAAARCSTVRLGPTEYFVAGDNRAHSRDSRQFGPVARAALLGKVVRIVA